MKKCSHDPTYLSSLSSILRGGIDLRNSELSLLQEEPVRRFFLAGEHDGEFDIDTSFAWNVSSPSRKSRNCYLGCNTGTVLKFSGENERPKTDGLWADQNG